MRTDPKAPKHQGISLIVLDMKSPGVSVSPIDLISGKSAFCQVFFDNVRVPQSQLIGPLNGGWNLGKSLLQHERKAMSKFGEFSLPTHFHLLPLIERYLPDSQAPDDQALRARAQACAMNEQAYNLTVQRMGEEARAGLDISAIMAIMKLVHTEQERDKFEILLDALGYRALGVEGEPFSGQELAITRGWLNSYALTISGGSSEVQLNVIAKRVLNLPVLEGSVNMSLVYSEEQRLLADSAREFLAARSPVAAQRRLRDEASVPGYDRSCGKKPWVWAGVAFHFPRRWAGLNSAAWAWGRFSRPWAETSRLHPCCPVWYSVAR